jgi:phosphinothricin acetyltransferase
MSDAPLIRPAAPADFAAITAIYGHHVLHGTASFETEAPPVDEMLRRHGDVVCHSLPYVVAELAGEVIGYAYAAQYRPRPAYRFTVEDSVYLRHDCAGKGVGRRLLDAVVRASSAAGCKQMIAIIGDSGNAASIRLHASAGFEPVGTLRNVGLKFDRWLDTVIMQREL